MNIRYPHFSIKNRLIINFVYTLEITNKHIDSMRFFILIFVTLLSQTIFSQTDSTSTNEKIYKVVDEMPRFPGCERGIMTKEERTKCAEENLLKFIYSNIIYPDSARANGTEGRVVLQFVVDNIGRVQDTKVVKDIGNGCGEEALRVVNIMRNKNVIWTPGKISGKAVKVQYTIPIKFKLETYTPPPPYTIFNGDSVYLEVEKPIQFKGDENALNIFLATETEYPPSGLDSCLIGTMRSNLLVKKDGSVQLLETVDYSNLGTDFLFEVIKLVPKTEGKWIPATYEGKAVTSIFPVRVDFKPTTEGCKSTVTNYEAATKNADTAVTLHDSGESEKGLLEISKAIEAFPNNTEWLYSRAVINLNTKNNAAACEDFQKIRDILTVPWYEKWIDLVCNF